MVRTIEYLMVVVVVVTMTIVVTKALKSCMEGLRTVAEALDTIPGQ